MSLFQKKMVVLGLNAAIVLAGMVVGAMLQDIQIQEALMELAKNTNV